MIVSIDVPDHVIASLVTKATEQSCSIEEVIIQQCVGPEGSLVELSDEQIDAKLTEWATFAVHSYDEHVPAFTLQQLVQLYEGMGVWPGYSSSTRKKLGKRFRAFIVDFSFKGYRLIVSGKTITNSTLYIVCKV